MNQWMIQDPKHVEEMSTAMKENHDFMNGYAEKVSTMTKDFQINKNMDTVKLVAL